MRLFAVSAGVADALCNLMTNPLFFIRTRMQSEIFRSLSEVKYKQRYPANMFKTMRIVVKDEGFRTLYQGLSASMIGVLMPVIYFPLYEKSKQYFRENFQQNKSE
jgi:hypothetical protein